MKSRGAWRPVRLVAGDLQASRTRYPVIPDATMNDQGDARRRLDRRGFVKASMVPAALAIADGRLGHSSRGAEPPPGGTATGPEIVDTNVHLFRWPFRRLKYDRTSALVQKLRRHRIVQAWAGSFEAVWHKQLDGANRRLADECRERGGGLLIPIGSVNPVWPDWEEDLLRCHEQYRMPGIRLYPAYHGYRLDHPELIRLLGAASRRGLLVQIAIRMEDERVHHPSIVATVVDTSPLPEVLVEVPEARVQLLNADTVFRSRHVRALIERTRTTFDIAAIEGDGGIGRLIADAHPTYQWRVPVDRLLFGTHAPFFPCESALLKLFESPLDRPQLDTIMFANARKLLG
jgi:predicted TIM-barrel fold metal-dependent hydrolase